MPENNPNKFTFKSFIIRHRFWILFVTAVSAILRLPELGFSHFYGDEIKTLYLDKTISATNFLLDQRKGPLQFLISWFMEKVSGGYSEFWIRLPYSLVGVATSVVFYLLLMKLFRSKKVAIFTSLLFALNGFYIAFARTAQYQVLYVFFGILAFYFLTIALSVTKRRILNLFLSSLALSFAFLAHYDAIFFLVPMVVYYVSQTKYKIIVKDILVFVLPLLLLAGTFYFPYIASGKFSENTVGYLEKRVEGKEYLSNDSFYTVNVYNPLLVFFILVGFGVFVLKRRTPEHLFLVVWLVLPFLVFQVVFKNPGTHIHNYILPALIFAGLGFNILANKYGKTLYFLVGFLFGFYFVVQGSVYIPSLNSGYPFKDSSLYGIVPLAKANKDYHLFLYGFPYYRSLDVIGQKFQDYNRVQGFYTNENTDVAKYYLKRFPVTEPGNNFFPQYYIFVPDSQEFTEPTEDFLSKYTLKEVVEIAPQKLAKIYYRL